MSYKIFIQQAFLFLLLSCSNDVSEVSNHIKGKVIGVKDGDTIVILFNGKPLTIRLAHIDCPEIKKGQPFGQAAKRFTSDHCFGQAVTAISEGKIDSHRRLVAVVINEKNENINKELVKAGLAWHFKKYSKDTSYANLETRARNNRAGLWADENPTPPWVWRKG